MYDPFFENLSKHIRLDAAEREQIAQKLQYKKLAKYELLLESGAYCRHIYFVSSGCLRVFHTQRDGTETNILFCPENWWAGDILSFSQDVPAVYAIEALEKTEVVSLSAVHLEQLYHQLPKLERFFRILFQNGFALYQGRLTLALSSSAEERYALFRRQYPGLENRIAQKHIASYLGITPVFLSMLRRKNKQDT